MKILKILFLFALSVFLISTASATMVVYGSLGTGTQHSAAITNGQSIILNADFGTSKSSMAISAKLYNSNGNLVYTFLSTSFTGNAYQPSYNITPAIYLTNGSYELILTGTDSNSADSDTLYLTVNPAVIPPVNVTNDTIAPIVNLNLPVNDSHLNYTTVTFNATVSDNVGIANVSLYINGTLNQTNSSGINNTNYLFTLNLSNGTYLWNFRACDTSGNCAFNSTSRTLTINTSSNQTNPLGDITPPSIQFVSNTPSSNSILSQNSIPVNITASDSGSGLKNITVYLYDSSRNLINSASATYSPFPFSFINLNSGTYYINATAFDNSGNPSSTETRTITLSFNSNSNSNSNIHANYSYNDVYQNQYLQQLNKTNSGINLTTGQKANSDYFGFALLLFEILLVLVLFGLIILIFARRKFNQ